VRHLNITPTTQSKRQSDDQTLFTRCFSQTLRLEKTLLVLGYFLWAGSCQIYGFEPTTYFPQREVTIIENALDRNGVEDLLLRKMVYAIRKAENGAEHLAFGIMHPKARTFDSQAGWAAASVKKGYQRWLKSDRELSFVEHFSRRYCPLNDPRDTTGLNRHWVGNVTHWISKLSS
jgi:hypothetical protein